MISKKLNCCLKWTVSKIDSEFKFKKGCWNKKNVLDQSQ